MVNARIWLAVKPSIGIPMMLIAVVLASLLVHLMILTHTTWYPAFLQGGKMPQRTGEVISTPDAMQVRLG